MRGTSAVDELELLVQVDLLPVGEHVGDGEGVFPVRTPR
jgi:hypothetical protein